MDFSLFAHMERVDGTDSHETLYSDFIDLCKTADQGGMRAIWTGEHHGMDFTIAPNPFLSLVDIAHHTQNVRLGTGTVIAPFWHPIALAGEAAATDLMTKGRLEIGIARGAYSYEYERIMPGMDAWEAGQRMRETAPTLRKLWQGMEEITSLMGRFNAAKAQNPEKSPKIMLLHHTYVAKDAADADRAIQELTKFYCYFGAWFQNKRPVTQGAIEKLTDQDVADNKMISADELARDLTVGTAAEVIDRIKRYEDLGYDEFAFWIDSGMSGNRKKESLARFINDVMPAFQ